MTQTFPLTARIPLELGLPVARKDGDYGIIVNLDRVTGDTVNRGIIGVLPVGTANGTEFWGASYCGLDLAHPAGFAYALRLLRGMPRWYAALSVDLGSLVDRWLSGQTTEADRLALAQALAEVTK